MGLRQQAHPTQRRAGAGGPCRRAQATSGWLRNGERPSARVPPPRGWGRGPEPEVWVGAAHERAQRLARARAWGVFFSPPPLGAVTRALCGPLVARSRPTCAFPLALSCGPWARTASGARASPRPPSFAARALLLVTRAVRSARRTPLPRGGRVAWRTTDLLSGEGGGLGPCPRDVRGSGGLGLRRNIAALRSGLRLRASARRTGLLVLTEECCYLSEARVLGGCLGRVLLCLGNRVLLAGEGIGSPRVSSPCTGALCRGEKVNVTRPRFSSIRN